MRGVSQVRASGRGPGPGMFATPPPPPTPDSAPNPREERSPNDPAPPPPEPPARTDTGPFQYNSMLGQVTVAPSRRGPPQRGGGAGRVFLKGVGGPGGGGGAVGGTRPPGRP